jgi:DNA-binding transcriptional LysR family regulator
MIEDVELRDVRTFLALAEELHFGRTAERLGVTPSRVSQTLRSLEARIGGRLFDRTSRTVRLTPLGEQLQTTVTLPYAQLLQAVEASREAATGVAGTLRIGMYTESLAGPHLVDVIVAVEARYPAVEVVLVNTGLVRSYLDVLRAGEVDLLATRLPLSDPDITIGPVLTHEERVLLVARSDPLARRESVTLDDFADRAVSNAPEFPREMMDALIPPVTPSGHHYRRIVNRSIEDMLMSIATRKQVHPTVPSFLEHHAHPAVTTVPISDLPPSQTALVWLTANRAPKVHAFARVATDVLAQTEPGFRQAGSWSGRRGARPGR